MKQPTLLAVGLLVWTVTGCGKGQSGSGPETNAASGNPLTAPVDYLDAVSRGKQRAVKTVDIASLTQAVQMFQVSEGRFPKDLQELVSMGYIARIPDPPYGHKIAYTPATGQVTVAPAD